MSRDKKQVLEALEKSLEMWKWIASNPEKDKLDYLDSIGVSDIEMPQNCCYLCELCLEETKDSRGVDRGFVIHCEDCPVIWGVGKQDKVDSIYCEYSSSPYKQWGKAKDLESKSRYASEVADRIQSAIDRLR